MPQIHKYASINYPPVYLPPCLPPAMLIYIVMIFKKFLTILVKEKKCLLTVFFDLTITFIDRKHPLYKTVNEAG